MQEHNPSSSGEGNSPQPGQVNITISKDKLMTGIIAIEFVLLLVFGFQIYGIKQQLSEGGTALAKADTNSAAVAAPAANPSEAAPAGNPAGGPIDIELTADDHVRGNANAAVTIVEYSDFECPFCEAAHPTIKQVMDTYGDDVKVVYRHFPLSFHPNAQKAAEASECAGDQGKFWEYHDKVFENQNLLAVGITQLKNWAKELGLNSGTFDSCLDGGQKAAKVTADLTQGTQHGVSGTPAFFVNGVKLSGAQPFSVFKQVIDGELQ